MKNRIRSLMALFVLLLAWGTSAYAGCTNAQFAGTWDVVFSDGNSCRLVINADGEVLTSPDRSLSTCFDPFRGETAPDSGTVDVGDECSANFALAVEGLEIQMFGRMAQTRDTGAGFFVVMAFGVKGSFDMIRLK